MKTDWESFVESLLDPPEVEQLPPPARGGDPVGIAFIAAPFCLLFMWVIFLAVRALF